MPPSSTDFRTPHRSLLQVFDVVMGERHATPMAQAQKWWPAARPALARSQGAFEPRGLDR